MSLEIHGLDLRLAKKMLFTGVNLRIDKPNLVVYVIDEAGLFIEGADVNILSSGHNLNSVTDALGTALTRFMPAINNTLTVSKVGYATSTQIIYNETPSTLSVYVQLFASEIRLKVVDNQNDPIEGATCRVLNAIGGSNNVLSFDGVDDYVSSAKMTPSGSYTVMMWVYLDTLKTASTGEWFANQRSDTSTKQDWQITRYTGFLGGVVRVYNTAGSTITVNIGPTGTNLPTGEWFHLAFHWDTSAGKVRTFYNGNQYAEGSISGTPSSASDNLILSKRGWTAGSHIDGNISDFRVYDAALTEAQIQAVMNERATTGVNLSNYWKMDEGSGTSLTDSEGSIDGTIYGATWAEADESFPLYWDGVLRYDTTPYDSQTTNANGLTTLNYQINKIHGLEVTLPGKRRFIMPFKRTARGLLDWQVMLSDYLATFATDRGNILINSEPENNDANFLIE